MQERSCLRNSHDGKLYTSMIMKHSSHSSHKMTSSLVAIIFLLFFSSCSVVNGYIRVEVETNFGTSGGSLGKNAVLSYNVVNEQGETLFRGGDLAVFSYGVWCVAPSEYSALFSSSQTHGNQFNSQPLLPSSQETFNGTIPGLGDYEAIRIRWSCNFSKEHHHPHTQDLQSDFPVITSFLNFQSNRAILFDIEYPTGAQNSSLVAFNQTNGDIATLATFPSFVMDKESVLTASTGGIHEEGKDSNNRKTSKATSYFPPAFPSAFSWEGTFVRSVRRLSVGPRGGPTIFYNSSDSTLANVLAASPFFDLTPSQNFSSSQHHFNQFTAGSNLDWTGIIPSFSPGKSGRLVSLPEGSSQSILLYQGSKGGITSTIKEWGDILQTASQSEITSKSSSATRESSKSLYEPISLKRPKLQDLTLEKIGYQTDNGAMYCFCHQSNCSEVLLNEKEYLDSIEIPIAYLSFQGAWTSGDGHEAPWCVEKWSADNGQDRSKYPMDTKDFQEALGIPLQLYAPYFCPNTTGYFQPDTPWKSVASNPNLPECSDYNYETVRASDSKDFFDWFFTKGIEKAGMISFESDFMNQNANCVDEFVESPIHGFDMFLQGMADAALGLGIPIQWCMSSPNVVMASLTYPAVTNFRASIDYCYGVSYNIGESSLLVWAVGTSPSKDTLWTTDNNRTAAPGCEWTADHENVAAELHVVLAIMSTGPVGISDAIGMTNATLLKRAISSDGSLLQPSKPITAVDSSFLEDNLNPNGYLYGTHGLDLSWIFVSFQLHDAFPVTLRDFWPPLYATGYVNDSNKASTQLVYRDFGSSSECIEGEDAIASGCVTFVTLEEDSDNLSPIFEAPQSSFDFPGSDFSPNVVTVWKECPEGSGTFFLGELNKYVALSPKRFRSIDCSEEGVLTTIRGSLHEVVEITLLIAQDENTWFKVVKEKVTISNPEGLEQFRYGTKEVNQHYSGATANENTADA